MCIVAGLDCTKIRGGPSLSSADLNDPELWPGTIPAVVVKGSIWVVEAYNDTSTLQPLQRYKLMSCPPGTELQSAEEMGALGPDPSLQQCKPCPLGTYIIEPDTDICEKCPLGKFNFGCVVFLFFEHCFILDCFTGSNHI